MLGLHEYGFAAAPRDSIVCLPECDSTNRIGASFETPSGRRLVILQKIVLTALSFFHLGINFLEFPIFGILIDKACPIHGNDFVHEAELMGHFSRRSACLGFGEEEQNLS